MLPKHKILAGYLRTVPGLIYNKWYRYCFPNEMAWSRKDEMVKSAPPPAVNALDLHMPLHRRIKDLSFDPTVADETRPLDARDQRIHQLQFVGGTWVVIKSGRYRKDFGIIVNDDYKEVDTSRYAHLIVVPRIKYKFTHLSRTRPRKAPLLIDFNLSPEKAWRSFMISNNTIVHATCIIAGCSSAWECNHQKNRHKRYQVFGQTVRGGFGLIVVSLDDLELAQRVPDEEFALFTSIAKDGPLGRIPPPDFVGFSRG